MRTTLLAVVLLVAIPALAEAKHHRFIGIHPVAKSYGGGLCYIEGPHVHVFAPDRVQYRDHHGAAFFVGDPVAYGYDGPRHVYKGHHPIHVHAIVGAPEVDIEFCYLDGPHYHAFTPPEEAGFEVVGDAYFYVGKPPRVYVEGRPAFVKINAMYRPIAYARPVVTVEAPAGWIGAHVDVVAPTVVVTPPAPRVRVEAGIRIPLPSVRVDIGIGGGVIHHHHRGKARGKHKHKKWRKHRRR